MGKIIVSNIRFPEEDWLQLKAAASSYGMSINEYLMYLSQVEAVRSVTGIPRLKRTPKREKGYEALRALVGLISRSKGKPMGASEDDKIIYGIE